MTVSLKTTHASEALDRLAQQFKSKVLLQSVIDAFTAQTQDLEGVLDGLRLLRLLANATGEQLDGIGQIVGEERLGKVDATYRLYLAARLLVNSGSGQVSRVADIVAILTSLPAEVLDYWPAGFHVRVQGQVQGVDMDAVADMLQQAKAGGVKAILEWYEDVPTFAFDGVTGDVAGFGNVSWESFADPLGDGDSPLAIYFDFEGMYWVGGTNGKLAYGGDPTSWALHEFATGFGADPITSICNSGVDLFAVIGGGSGKVAYKSGVAWVIVDGQCGTSDINSIIAVTSSPYNGHVLVADGGYVSISTSDGSVWVALTTGVATDLVCAAYSPTAIVVVGDAGVVLSMTTYPTMTARAAGFGSSNVNVVRYANGMFIAGGDGGKLATSTDGVAWTQRAPEFGTSAILDLAWSASLSHWVAVGADGKASISADGITWTPVDPGLGTDSIKFVAVCGISVKACGTATTNQVSSTTDLINWGIDSTPFADEVMAFHADEFMFIAGSAAPEFASIAAETDTPGTFARAKE